MKTQEINQPAELNVPVLIALAEDLESGRYKEYICRFDMRRWNSCIAGLCAAKYGLPHWISVQQFLGLGYSDCPHDLLCSPDAMNKGPEHAAKVIRHLAATGEVDWISAGSKVKTIKSRFMALFV